MDSTKVYPTGAGSDSGEYAYSPSLESRTRASESLLAGFNAVIRDAEDLLKATANYSAEGFAAARSKFQDSLSLAKLKLADTQARVSDSAHHAADATQKYVVNNPWKSLAIVGSVGLIIGMLMKRHPQH